MATTAAPYPGEGQHRPNIPSATHRLPAVKTYDQIDDEIIATLRPTLGWFALLGIAILCLLGGIATWMYQIHEGLGAAGYQPPVMWGVYIITFGDAADPNWSVAQLAHDRRAYHVFEELNTFTAVVYLKKVNHPAAGASRAPAN